MFRWFIGALLALSAFMGYQALFSGTQDYLTFTGVANAFIGHQVFEPKDPVEADLRLKIIQACGQVPGEKLYIAVANQAIDSGLEVTKAAKSLTVDVIAAAMSQAAQLDEEKTHETECLALLTIFRVKYRAVWDDINKIELKGSQPLAGIEKVVDARLTKSSQK